jgi:hypothetical protein
LKGFRKPRFTTNRGIFGFLLEKKTDFPGLVLKFGILCKKDFSRRCVNMVHRPTRLTRQARGSADTRCRETPFIVGHDRWQRELTRKHEIEKIHVGREHDRDVDYAPQTNLA